GARFLGDINSRVDASIGDNVVVTAPTVQITAANTSQADEFIEVTSQTGGLAGSSAVTHELDVVHDTTAGIGDQALINADTVLVSGPADGNSSVSVLATNDSRFNNAASVGSGNVFGSSINVATDLNYTQYDASVEVGEDAVLKSAGEVTLATRSSADSTTDTSAVSSSVGTGGSAKATTTVDSANTVTIAEGASIASQDDINLLAGQTSVLESVGDPVPDINEFILEANVDGYVTSPLSSALTHASSTASINQTNHVTVGKNALLQAVSDAYLLTDEGLAAPTGSASLRIPTGSVSSTPDTSATADNQVKVDGDIQVGLFNRQFFTMNQDTNGNLTVQDENGDALSAADLAAFGSADTNVDLSDALAQRINTLLQETAWFSGSSLDDVYAEQHAFWTELVTGLGGTLSFDTTPVQVSNVVLPAATLSDLFATSGNIVIEADNLVGTAGLTAPTDTTITLNNETPLTLLLSDLLIPDRPGGQVRFNGVQVTSNDDIQAGIENTDLDPLVNFDFNYSYVDGSAADAETEPSIVVANSALPGADVPSNLFFNGDVSNRSGDVSIDAAQGSVLVNGQMTAGSLSISSGGDFILSDDDSDGDGFFHVGGDPFDLYADVAQENEAADSEVNSGPATPINGTTGSTQPDAGATIVAGSVLISAENLNING
ncbi:MAG: hypothetical protein GY708_22025, partial [Actinomycetia bacterium]|nr:hypothetical protein [Actinomycetes bacterium]